jgi:hypothetical protein
VQGAGGVDAELELGVGDDDAAGGGVVGGLGVQRDGGVTGFGDELGAGLAGALEGFGEDGVGAGLGLLEADVLVVVADLGLAGRGEDRGGQLLGLLEAGGQLDAADGAGVLVVLPAGADHVAAHHGLDGQRGEALDDQRAAAHLIRSSAATTLSGSMPVSWLGTMWPSLANQKLAIAVSTSPLRGIGSGRITSKADRRSEVTMSSLSASMA